MLASLLQAFIFHDNSIENSREDETTMNTIYIIVDGSNVAFSRKTGKNKARFANLEIMVHLLDDLKTYCPIEYEIITDASLKHRIDDPGTLEASYKSGTIVECPAGIAADEFIIDFASTRIDQAIIISNDKFSEYDTHQLTLCKFIIIFNTIVIPNFKHLFPEIASNLQQYAEIAISSEDSKSMLTTTR